MLSHQKHGINKFRISLHENEKVDILKKRKKEMAKMKAQVTERENIFNKHDTKEVHVCLTERVFTN